jgi:hypothetical protein
VLEQYFFRFLFLMSFSFKGQIKQKADWSAVGSPKKKNERICLFWP